jgi:ABC-type Fe3+/spermidine/putrescine transport system ATPase subunit
MSDNHRPIILDMQNITKRFGQAVAIDNVSFSLERGKVITFVGPSGCGKTTLLRMISGLTEPTEGKVILDGEDITYLRANDRNTAMVFQNYALFPHMTVAQNLGFGLQIRKKPKEEIRKEVLRLLELVQLEGMGGRKPQELSGGQQQRVALGRALSLHPKILLLDEPLSNLDANLRVMMRDEIRKLQKKLSLSIIFVTHDQEEAMAISDIIVVMDNGVVKQIGKPTEIYEKPADRFVANFIGHINMFEGRVEKLTDTGMAFKTPYGILHISNPDFPIADGDNLCAVVRPESIDIVGTKDGKGDKNNIFQGEVQSSMYVGSTMRYTISVKDKTVYVDVADPQYNGMFPDGDTVNLVLKDRIHLLKDF